MVEFIFIKGKNPLLSSFEINSYLDSRGRGYEIKLDKKDFLILDLKDDEGLDEMMKSLGGTIKISKVAAKGETVDIEGSLNSLGLDPKIGERFVFGISVYSEKDSHKLYNALGKSLKRSLRGKDSKASFFGFSRKSPKLTNVEIIKGLASPSDEIVLCTHESRFYLGRTVFVHDPFQFQKRDVGRPFQRTIFSIPPRLSNIMINLSYARKGQTLLDPFCGIGSILQEALLRGVNVIGIDKDSECIRSAEGNLKWLRAEYEVEASQRLVCGDARCMSEVENESVDAIATEPYLGPPIRKTPSQDEAMVMLKDVEELYRDSIKEMKRVLKPGKRLAIVSPRIRLAKDRSVSINFKGIAENAGFTVEGSFTDSERRHRTIREIFVLQKPNY